jgi:hypothetical protein
MGRPERPTSADVVYHVLNRARAQDAVRRTPDGTMPRLNGCWGRRVSESPYDSWRTASCPTTGISSYGRGGMAPVSMHELAHAAPYATVASASPPGLGRARIPRALHIFSCRNERVSPNSLSRRGAESSAGGPHRTSGAVVLE